MSKLSLAFFLSLLGANPAQAALPHCGLGLSVGPAGLVFKTLMSDKVVAYGDTLQEVVLQMSGLMEKGVCQGAETCSMELSIGRAGSVYRIKMDDKIIGYEDTLAESADLIASLQKQKVCPKAN